MGTKDYFWYHARYLAIDKNRPWQLCAKGLPAILGKFPTESQARTAAQSLQKGQTLVECKFGPVQEEPVTTTIQIDKCRRINLYAEGGMDQERYVQGQGWILANDEEWNLDENTLNRIRQLVRSLT